jgi:hypothetical protein
MTAPNKREISRATRALLAWFESQEINPAKAGLVMADLITTDLAACHQHHGDGDVGLELYIKMLREMYSNKVEVFE